MKNFLAKFVNAFSKEFSAEIARNPQLRSEVDHIKKKMEIFNFKIPPQKYIVHNRNINEFKPGPFISEKSFMKNKSWILSSSGILKSILNDYYKLSYIEDHLVDHVIIGGVKNINDIDKYMTDSVITSIQLWCESQLEDMSVVDLYNKMVVIEDIRCKEIKDIQIINLKKVITARCEITASVYGTDSNGQLIKVPKHYACSIGFEKDGIWKANSFSCNEL